uniref:Uncharacterized protein n=1 Tax=Populus trichocarpa TaxID=3694 RepID=A0A2K1R5A8_POPTR
MIVTSYLTTIQLNTFPSIQLYSKILGLTPHINTKFQEKTLLKIYPMNKKKKTGPISCFLLNSFEKKILTFSQINNND